jgi:hypothetical protein
MKQRPSLLQYTLFYSLWAFAVWSVAGMVVIIVDFSLYNIVFYIYLGLYLLTAGLVVTGAIVITMPNNPDQSIYPSSAENNAYEGVEIPQKVSARIACPSSPECDNGSSGIGYNRRYNSYKFLIFSVHILDPLFEGHYRRAKKRCQPNANKTFKYLYLIIILMTS